MFFYKFPVKKQIELRCFDPKKVKTFFFFFLVTTKFEKFNGPSDNLENFKGRKVAPPPSQDMEI